MKHILAFNATTLRRDRSDVVMLLIDGVEMDDSVDVRGMISVLQANCLDVISPACPSCRTKRLIHPNRNYVTETALGRRVEYAE